MKNSLIEAFKDCSLQASEVCGFAQGKVIRKFGLNDFLENSLADDDDAPTIVVKALSFFCCEASPHQEEFKFAVLAVGIFLSELRGEKHVDIQQSLRDLVSILNQGVNEEQIRRWIDSNF